MRKKTFLALNMGDNRTESGMSLRSVSSGKADNVF